jgi:hypothetical protein
VLVISDGLEARIGAIRADRERFMPWRTIEGETPFLCPPTRKVAQAPLPPWLQLFRVLVLVFVPCAFARVQTALSVPG